MSIQHISRELKIHELDSEVLQKLKNYSITPKHFVRFKNQFSTKTKDNYIIKMILDSEARKFGSKGHLEEAKEVYGRLAAFIASEERDNPVETLKNMHRLSLRQYLRLGYSSVRIINCGEGGCAACRSISNKIVDISEALEKMPLPNPLCTFDLYRNNYSFCRCSYEPVNESIKISNRKKSKDDTSLSQYLLPGAIFIIIIMAVFYFLNF